MAFNWDEGSVPTYQATVAPSQKGSLPHFLPGQAVLISTSSSTSTSTPAPATALLPTPTSHTTYSPSPPSPAVHSSTSSGPSSQSVPRKRVNPSSSSSSSSSSHSKKSDGKARHFNDKFADQTGRFKIGTSSSHDSERTTHGSGPCSSMYRMEMNSPVPHVAGGSSASPQSSSRSRQAAQTPQAVTNDRSDIRPGNGETTVNPSSTISQPKASNSKISTSNRSSTKRSATNLASSSPSQYYRRDYEREKALPPTSRDSQNLDTRARVASTSQHQSHPREAASSPSLSNTGKNLVEAFSRPSALQPVEHVLSLTQ